MAGRRPGDPRRQAQYRPHVPCTTARTGSGGQNTPPGSRAQAKCSGATARRTAPDPLRAIPGEVIARSPQDLRMHIYHALGLESSPQ